MPRHHRLISRLLGAVLLPGCIIDSSGGDTLSATTTTSTTGASLSGSATSAPGMSDGTGSGSTPTTGTTTGPDSTGNPRTSGPCGSFLECEDLPGNPVECDVFAQDCPEGQKCAAVITDGGSAWDGLRCVDVNGTDEPGDPCKVEDVFNGIDSCVKGAMCWDVDEQGVGYCVAQCTGSEAAPVCENKAACTISSWILILCIPTCDPLLQDCDPDGACYAVNGDFQCAPDGSGAEGQANDPCEFINLCDPGLTCVDAALVGLGCPEGSTGCCTPFCTYPDGACPNPDQQCVQYYDPMQLPPNDPWLGVGLCGIVI